MAKKEKSEKRPTRRIEKIPLTPERIDALRAEEAATSVSAYALLKDVDDAPEGLTSRTVYNWFAGRVKNAPANHYAYVLDLWLAQPRNQKLKITPEMRTELEAAIAATSIPLRLAIEPPQPEGCTITLSRIRQWRDGTTKTAMSIDWNFLLERLTSPPFADDMSEANGRKAVRYGLRRVALTPEMRDALCHERERTGIGIHRLLASASDVPERLHTTTIHRWLSSQNKWAYQDHYDFVLSQWKAFPDDEVFSITPRLREKLKAELERSGVAVANLRKRLPAELDPPSELTIGKWTRGEVTTASRSQWELVMNALAQYKHEPSSRIESAPTKPSGATPESEGSYSFGGVEYVFITDEIHARLIAERDRTGIDHNRLFRQRGYELAGANVNTVRNWFSRKTKSAERSALDVVIAVYESLPDK